MNEIMLEETRDTITVPATLMIRMLGTIHILRKQFYSTKLNFDYLIFHKNRVFFVKTKEFLFQH